MSSAANSSRPHAPTADQLAEFRRAALDPKINKYPGALEIVKSLRLTAAQREIEARFAAQIEADPEYFIDKYRHDYGNVINTDNARELSPDYRKSKRSRTEHSASVHEPASAVVKEVWRRVLAEVKLAGNDTVVFLAGGGGSGKTTATDMPGVKEYKDLAQVIFDTTMASTTSSIRKVEEALNAGKRVAVIYIHRPIEQAVKGVVERAVKEGRVVPIDVLAHDHFAARQTIIALEKRYRADGAVFILVLDNSRDGQAAVKVSVDFIRRNRYDDISGLRTRIEEVLTNEWESRKGAQNALPEYAYQAFLGQAVDE
jgi:Zeta toxin